MLPKALDAQRLHDTHDGAEADEAITDRYWLAYFILYLLGVGSLLPWNVMITPTQYFQLRFDGSPFVSSFESVLSVSFTFTCLLGVISFQWLQHVIPIRVSILSGLLLMLLALGTLAVLATTPLFASDDEILDVLAGSSSVQFVALITCGAICGIGQAFLTVNSYAYAAVYQRPQCASRSHAARDAAEPWPAAARTRARPQSC